MVASLFPEGRQSYVTATGAPAVGWKLATYQAGTNTPAPTWQDPAEVTPNTNPIILDARGECVAFWRGSYKIVLMDASNAIIWTQDNVTVSDLSATLALYVALADLASAANARGAGLVGFSHAALYAAGTVGKKEQQIVSPLDAPYNAVGDGSADDTTPMNTAIAAQGQMGSLLVPAGKKFRVTGLTNARGIRSEGGGQVVLGTGAAARQLNDYARGMDFVMGREYMFRLYQRIGASGTTLTGFFYGDSTVATAGNGGGFAGAAGTPDVLMKTIFQTNGVRNAITFTNRAIGGTNWSNANPIPDVGVNTDIMFFKYSINHVSGQDVDAEIAAMRAQLTAIRAQTYGGANLLTIVLVSPNSTDDTAGNRTSVWYELLRQGYEQAARDFKCVYVDIYAMFQDSTTWANFYADAIAVHPGGLLQQQLWAAIGNALVPPSATMLSTGNLWVNLAFANGWGNYGVGTDPASVSISMDGGVRFRGAITRASGAATVNQTMFILPNINYYPTGSKYFLGETFDGAAWSTTHIGIDVAGNGAPRDTSAKNQFVALDGLAFRTW